MRPFAFAEFSASLTIAAANRGEPINQSIDVDVVGHAPLRRMISCTRARRGSIVEELARPEREGVSPADLLPRCYPEPSSGRRAMT